MKNGSLISHEGGMTLIEMLVVIGVMLILLMMALESTFQVTKAAADNRDRIRLQQEAEIIVADISTYLKEADAVVVYPDDRGLAYRTPEASIGCYLDREAKRLRCIFADSNLSRQSSAMNPPDIAVTECIFKDLGNRIAIDITLERNSQSIVGRAVYRVRTEIAVPNRSSGDYPWADTDPGAGRCADTGIHGRTSADSLDSQH